MLLQCKLRAFELDKVISNNEYSTADIKGRVPDESYRNTKSFLEIKENNALEKKVVLKSKKST